MFDEILQFIRSLYPDENPVPLHAPRLNGNEKKYLADCVDSTFVSYVGEFVTRLESTIATYTGAKHAVALSSGTSALHMALHLLGVKSGDLVVTQAMTFVATANAVAYTGAEPVFLDSDRETGGLAPESLAKYLELNAEKKGSACYEKSTGRKIAACVPVHIFGHPCKIDRLVEICDEWSIPLVEDAAESLGSLYRGKHTGLFGKLAVLSFNGNKTVTTGGGGMILSQDEELAVRARYITTTAKRPHPYEFFHTEIGYNFRMPNVNAAVGCAQMERIDHFVADKRRTASLYREFFRNLGLPFFDQPEGAESNFWLNSVRFGSLEERNRFLEYSNSRGIQTRPLWGLVNSFPMFQGSFTDELSVARELQDRIVCLPSSVRMSP